MLLFDGRGDHMSAIAAVGGKSGTNLKDANSVAALGGGDGGGSASGGGGERDGQEVNAAARETMREVEAPVGLHANSATSEKLNSAVPGLGTVIQAGMVERQQAFLRLVAGVREASRPAGELPIVSGSSSSGSSWGGDAPSRVSGAHPNHANRPTLFVVEGPRGSGKTLFLDSAIESLEVPERASPTHLHARRTVSTETSRSRGSTLSHHGGGNYQPALLVLRVALFEEDQETAFSMWRPMIWDLLEVRPKRGAERQRELVKIKGFRDRERHGRDRQGE